MLSKNPEKMESFVGSNARIKGEMTVEGTLRLDGTNRRGAECRLCDSQ